MGSHGPQGHGLSRPKSKRRRDAPDATSVSRPGLALGGRDRACASGGSMLVRQRLARSAPALIFLLAECLSRAEPGGIRPGRRARLRRRAGQRISPVVKPVRARGGDSGPCALSQPGLVVVAVRAGFGGAQHPGRGSPQRARSARARVRLRAGRRRVGRPPAQLRPRHQAQPAGGQRRLRRGAGRHDSFQPFRPVWDAALAGSGRALRTGSLP